MEIALRTQPYEAIKAKYVCRRPRGAVVTGCTTAKIVAKWVEIVGDLMAPYKREQFRRFPYYQQIVAIWRPAWRDSWLAVDRLPSGTNEVHKDFVKWLGAWKEITADGVLLEALPLDPRGDVHVTDTWVWGAMERKLFFVVGVASEDVHLLDNDEYEHEGTLYRGPRWRLDYEAELGLGAEDRNAINDPARVFHPRLNHPVSRSLFRDQRDGLTAAGAL